MLWMKAIFPKAVLNIFRQWTVLCRWDPAYNPVTARLDYC